jgi:8-oxo-dGTP pyrophosphatase MutT (NUDIX family)
MAENDLWRDVDENQGRDADERRRTQRLGAYAVVVHDGALLLTRISEVGYPAGWWALPGGGVDHGESPHDAVERELYEETGLQARSRRLVDVHDVHTVNVGRGDQYEDFHGVHLLYAIDVDATVTPHVVEQGGTTDLVRWVPLDELPPRNRERGAPDAAPGPLLPVVEHVLDHLDHFFLSGGV